MLSTLLDRWFAAKNFLKLCTCCNTWNKVIMGKFVFHRVLHFHYFCQEFYPSCHAYRDIVFLLNAILPGKVKLVWKHSHIVLIQFKCVQIMSMHDEVPDLYQLGYGWAIIEGGGGFSHSKIHVLWKILKNIFLKIIWPESWNLCGSFLRYWSFKFVQTMILLG